MDYLYTLLTNTWACTHTYLIDAAYALYENRELLPHTIPYVVLAYHHYQLNAVRTRLVVLETLENEETLGSIAYKMDELNDFIRNSVVLRKIKEV